MNNPLLEINGLPNFTAIEATHIEPAIDELIKENKSALDALLNNTDGFTWQNLAQKLEDRGLPGCAGGAPFEGDHQTVPNSTHVCEVELDPETGHVTIEQYVSADDLGVKLNPMIAEGQIHGGIVQGIGQAWLEHTVYEEGSGQLLSGSFMDYCLPRATDIPQFTLVDGSVATENNHLGMKGVGELGTNGGLAPFMLALYDAMGSDKVEMPATPEKIWRALQTG